MDTLKFRVRGQALTLINTNINLFPVTDTVNQYLCQFEFNDDWDDLNKIVVFKNASYNLSKEAYLGTSNECYIPWEILSNSGDIYIEVIGTEVRGDVVTVRIPSTVLVLKWSIQEGLLDVSANKSPTPDLFEQFVELVQGYSEAAIVARDEAVSAKDVVVSSVETVASAVVTVTAKVNEANVAATSAASSANAASISETNATASAAAAVGASEAASVYSSTAEEAAETAELSKDAAVSAKEDAESAKTSAQSSATIAGNSATSASSSASNAAASAESAGQSATASANSADEASGYADGAKASVLEIENLTVSAETLPEGGQAVVVKSGGSGTPYNLLFKIPVGNTGNGISSTVLNDDYTLTVTFTDGTSYTTPSIRGEKGDSGGSANWGEIGGTITNQSDLMTELNGKASSSHTHTKSDVTDFSHTHTKSEISDFPALSTVATSGSYNDLTNKPTIPTVTGTVTSVTINATSPIAVDNTSAITTSGTRTLSHENSGVTAGTYRSVTVDAKGHITSGTNPTTVSDYGITDVYTKTEVDSKVTNHHAIYSATTEPTSADGNNGDIWIVYS